MEGADTKSVSVSVEPQGSGEETLWSDEPRREQFWSGNWSSAAASLVVLAKVTAGSRTKPPGPNEICFLPLSCYFLFPVQVVHARSVVLAWKLYPSRGATFESALPLPRWTSAAVHIHNSQISYTAKVSMTRQKQLKGSGQLLVQNQNQTSQLK